MKADRAFLSLRNVALVVTALAITDIRELEDSGRDPPVPIDRRVAPPAAAGSAKAPICTAPSRPTSPCDFMDCTKLHTGEIA